MGSASCFSSEILWIGVMCRFRMGDVVSEAGGLVSSVVVMMRGGKIPLRLFSSGSDEARDRATFVFRSL